MKNWHFYRLTRLSFVCFFIVASQACDCTGSLKVYSSSAGGYDKTVALSQPGLDFLVTAYSIGSFKLDLASEARIRSTSAESIQLARPVFIFNTTINSQLEHLASKHNLVLPMDLTNSQKVVWKQFVKEKGWNFDKKFIKIAKQTETLEKEIYTKAVRTENKDIKKLALKIDTEFQLHKTLMQTLNKTEERHSGELASRRNNLKTAKTRIS